MEGSVPQASRAHRLSMPWGLLVGLELVAFALVSAGLVLDVFPTMFELEWGCVSSSGELHTSADTYVATFAVLGALGWIATAAVTAVVHAAGRTRLALAIPVAWFATLVLLAFGVAAAIGPITC